MATTLGQLVHNLYVLLWANPLKLQMVDTILWNNSLPSAVYYLRLKKLFKMCVYTKCQFSRLACAEVMNREGKEMWICDKEQGLHYVANF